MKYSKKLIKKVLKYMKKQNKDIAVTASQISKDVGIHYYGLKGILEQLANEGLIELISTNKNTTLVRIKK